MEVMLFALLAQNPERITLTPEFFKDSVIGNLLRGERVEVYAGGKVIAGEFLNFREGIVLEVEKDWARVREEGTDTLVFAAGDADSLSVQLPLHDIQEEEPFSACLYCFVGGTLGFIGGGCLGIPAGGVIDWAYEKITGRKIWHDDSMGGYEGPFYSCLFGAILGGTTGLLVAENYYRKRVLRPLSRRKTTDFLERVRAIQE